VNTIKLKINFDGEVTLNNNLKARAPFEMKWFPDNDLVIETSYERIVFNTATFQPVVEGVYLVTPKTADKNLEQIKDANIKLYKNNVAAYLVINDKFAFRLPQKALEIL